MERRELLTLVGATGVSAAGIYGVYSSVSPGEGSGGESGAQSAQGQENGEDETDDEDGGGDGEEDDEETEDDWETRDGWLLRGITPTPDAHLEEWLGTQHVVVGNFQNIGRSDDEIEQYVYGTLESAWERGYVPHVYWQPFFPDPEETSNEVNQEIAEGEWDDPIETWAETLADWAVTEDEDDPDRRVYLNLAPEFNGDWSPWSPAIGHDDEEDFVAMWQHIHDIIADAGLESDHVQWIWTLDNTTRGVDREACYPGDEYVDWAGIHGYNWATWGAWLSPDDVYDRTIDTIRGITDKPIAITEFGSSSETEDGDHDPERKDEWIADAYDYLEDEEVRMTLYFNISKETDWAVFDAEYGADTVEVDDETYNVYPAYREAVTADGILGPHPDHPRHLTDEEFAGELDGD